MKKLQSDWKVREAEMIKEFKTTEATCQKALMARSKLEVDFNMLRSQFYGHMKECNKRQKKMSQLDSFIKSDPIDMFSPKSLKEHARSP